MNIPPKIQSAIERLNVELDYIQEKTQYGLAVLKPILDIFPNNNLLVQFYGYLNNSLFLINIYIVIEL